MCGSGSVLGAIAGFALAPFTAGTSLALTAAQGAVLGGAIGASYDTKKAAEEQADRQAAQTDALIESQNEQTEKLIQQQKSAQSVERKKADTKIADTLSRETRRPSGGGTKRGTLLTGGQGIPDSQLNLGKTLLGQ